MERAFWKGKKVFLTGHTGFKGSWLSLWLQDCGAIVQGYALAPPTDPSLYEVARVAEGVRSLEADIRAREILTACLHDFAPDIVIHMAAQPLVRYSYRNPVETYESNVMGTVNLLEAVRTQPAGVTRAVLIITSDKCYENREWVWGYRENEPMGGHDPYSNSKGCSELVVSSYRNSFFPAHDYANHGVALASARAGNVIGGGDWAEDRLVPDIMTTIVQKQKVIIRSPHAIRPWQHVLEPLRGYLMLVEKLWHQGSAFAEGWNFGPHSEDARPVSWIVDQLTASWGEGAGWELDSNTNPHEAHYLKLDCSKAQSHLGFMPRLRLEKTLAWIIDWYKAYQGDADMREFTLQQIRAYEALQDQ